MFSNLQFLKQKKFVSIRYKVLEISLTKFNPFLRQSTFLTALQLFLAVSIAVLNLSSKLPIFFSSSYVITLLEIVKMPQRTAFNFKFPTK